MKYMLIMHGNPAIWDALPEERRQAVMNGHGAFMEATRASGELIGTAALDPDLSKAKVVRVKDGIKVATDGPYLEAKEFFGGFYLVEVADEERALELAAMIPDAAVDGLGIQVSPVVFYASAEV
ncbi:hypothetical protein Afil01_45030 [Actinorhabdospora filicis]|uniref:YCII-related domain-containing protein n=1 Tax=Actinorhabdospora filicis TaxID=1785913 RepID=A0A9W6SPC3_9ACTN|nr:YciI family protein [Actinorhabdospora filicis]GLZ79696.1 hypothetical protein Afil01_45030 [Actinorhabdospora filicis]